jgi:hypothetical protein
VAGEGGQRIGRVREVRCPGLGTLYRELRGGRW